MRAEQAGARALARTHRMLRSARRRRSIRSEVRAVPTRARGRDPSDPSKYFGNSPDFWLLLQHRWDLYKAMKAEAQELKRIQPIQVSH